MSEYQNIINMAAGLGIGVFGWFARQLWDAVTELKADLAKLREEIAKDYVRKDDLQTVVSEMRAMFQRILDKLDNKADKP